MNNDKLKIRGARHHNLKNIDLDIHIAGPLVRILAFTIDTLIRTGVQIALLIVLALLGKVGLAQQCQHNQ